MGNKCGNCRHWHPWKESKQHYSTQVGDCDKVPVATFFETEDDIYCFSGKCHEDEEYDMCFNCFETKELENNL